MLTAALFAVAQDMEATLVSTDRKMDKEDVVYIYICHRISLSHLKKKERNSAISNTIDEPEGYYA